LINLITKFALFISSFIMELNLLPIDACVCVCVCVCGGGEGCYLAITTDRLHDNTNCMTRCFRCIISLSEK